MTRIEQAVAYSKEGFNCSQSVCTAFAESLGVDRDVALKVSAGFGGGIGRMGDTCGAVSGACMALGLKYGNTEADPDAKTAMYTRIQDFMTRFKARREALDCRDLLGYDVSIPEEYEKAKSEEVFTTLCPKIIRDAGEILEEMLQED